MDDEKDWVCPECTDDEECVGCWVRRSDWERVFPSNEEYE